MWYGTQSRSELRNVVWYSISHWIAECGMVLNLELGCGMWHGTQSRIGLQNVAWYSISHWIAECGMVFNLALNCGMWHGTQSRIGLGNVAWYSISHWVGECGMVLNLALDCGIWHGTQSRIRCTSHRTLVRIQIKGKVWDRGRFRVGVRVMARVLVTVTVGLVACLFVVLGGLP